MIIKTWSQNPSLKASLEEAWENTPPLATGDGWSVVETQIQGHGAWIVRWFHPKHKGALRARVLCKLADCLETCKVEYLYLWMASAGADVFDPFPSLVELNRLIGLLHALCREKGVQCIGIVDPPLGTYGGASLLLASTVHTLWCETPTDLHLTGMQSHPS